VTFCPQCGFDTLVPDELTIGRHLRCKRCNCIVIPGDRQVRGECTRCGRRRCAYRPIGSERCARWIEMPSPVRGWRNPEMFGGTGEGT
jgi:DNA-directed RNA polymerase subunit M/transcription elongation factor TFIIS